MSVGVGPNVAWPKKRTALALPTGDAAGRGRGGGGVLGICSVGGLAIAGGGGVVEPDPEPELDPVPVVEPPVPEVGGAAAITGVTL